MTTRGEDDLALARAVRDLDREVMPDRDLWQGIERQIVEAPQKQRRDWDWMPYGIAASLVVATASLMLNLMPAGEPQMLTVEQSVDRMESEYLQVRNPLVEQFNQVNRDVDEQTMTDVHRNLEILRKARMEIEAAVREEPDNARLVELLMSIHEQELELLQRDYGQPARFM